VTEKKFKRGRDGERTRVMEVACPFPPPQGGQQEEPESRGRKHFYLFYQWREEETPAFQPTPPHNTHTHIHRHTTLYNVEDNNPSYFAC